MLNLNRLGYRNFEKDIDRIDTEMFSATVAAGGLENKIHLIPSGTGAITTYDKDAAGVGLAAAITASVSGDAILIPNGTIGGNHTNKTGVLIFSLGYNTILSGTITNNGILAGIRVTGTFTNNGYTYNMPFATASGILSGNAHAITSTNNGVIAGGDTNALTNLADNSGILSGADNTIDAANECAIGSGNTNLIDDSAFDSGIWVGFNNHIHNSAYASGVLAGDTCEITNYYAIANGAQAKADKRGQVAHAVTQFAAVGDAQRSHFIVKNSITHSTSAWTALHTTGATQRLTIAADTVWTFNILLVGTSQGCAKSFSFRIEGVIENDGGTTSILASTVTTIYDTDDVSFDARVTADDTNDALLIEVSDSDGAGDVVRWVASVETAEVSFPA